MARRLLVTELRPGVVELPADQAHHARDVLRLGVGAEVELFTAGGESALATLTSVSPGGVLAEVGEIRRQRSAVELTIASAVPKAARADWMIEKLSELGVARFIPLATARSVVHPEGKNKIERWERLAAESAKQSKRPGVMAIDPLTPLPAVLDRANAGRMAYLSTGAAAVPAASVFGAPRTSILLLIGPEGGWSAEEQAGFDGRALTAVSLGATILRVETAAIAAAAVVAALSVEPPAR
jgi:16S rRNA (uracil1498-N3)-methyltransferase